MTALPLSAKLVKWVHGFGNLATDGLLVRDIAISGQFEVERRPGTYPGEAIQLRGRNVTVSGSMRSGMVESRKTDGMSLTLDANDAGTDFIRDGTTLNEGITAIT
ncbi:MAG TPA: hypothetical protein VGW34_10890 [Allosphingosinicella sp.]|nr:hypothetical protein [Allosphingosinicella sp.]